MRLRRPLVNPPLTQVEPYFAAIRDRAQVAEGYAPDVFFEAQHAGGEDRSHVEGGRSDATGLPLVTIDPEGSRDLDQALHIEALDGGHRIYYAIADVGAHVAPGGALDADTRRRGLTVYCPDRRIGLHPPVLSEGYGSLLPGQRTKAVLWILELDDSGDLGRIEVFRTWVRSRRQYSYSELDASPPHEARDLIRFLAEVGEQRRKVAEKRGAVTLPKPSQEVRVQGGRLFLEFRAASAIEEDNAQISLLTGEAGARLMLDGGLGILRTMPPADPRALTRLRRQARALRITWPENESYAAVIKRLDRSAPSTAAFFAHATSLFRGAAWSPFDDADPGLPRPENLVHGALGVPYAHVTAPLRRLADRYATEICLAVAAGRSIPEWVHEALPRIAAEMARGDHVARKVDRECIDAVEAAALEPRVGEIFEGVGLDEYTVQLADPAVLARCGGAVKVGEEQQVRLVSAHYDKGPFFQVVP
jgi:exoribonuclease R